MEAEQKGGYSVYVPELPECASQGETRQEAIKNIKEAIHLYCWSVKQDRESLQKSHIMIRDISVPYKT
ncbi:MAG: type II toxin-antitoxin system HicB family antitoxin [Candidatus Omnitrophota bacterium]